MDVSLQSANIKTRKLTEIDCFIRVKEFENCLPLGWGNKAPQRSSLFRETMQQRSDEAVNG